MVIWIPPRERERRDAIRRACAQHGWFFLETQQVAPVPMDRVVIGLAMWSDSDIDFFSKLGHSLLADQSPLVIFDMEDVRTRADFERFVPGGRLPLQTPVMGVIRGERLTQQIEGDAVLAMHVFDLARVVTLL